MSDLIVVTPYDVDDGHHCRWPGCDFRAKDMRGRTKHESVHAEADPNWLGGYANRVAVSLARDVTPYSDGRLRGSGKPRGPYKVNR